MLFEFYFSLKPERMRTIEDNNRILKLLKYSPEHLLIINEKLIVNNKHYNQNLIQELIELLNAGLVRFDGVKCTHLDEFYCYSSIIMNAEPMVVYVKTMYYSEKHLGNLPKSYYNAYVLKKVIFRSDNKYEFVERGVLTFNKLKQEGVFKPAQTSFK